MENTLQAPVYQHDNTTIANKLNALDSQQFAIVDNFLPQQDYDALLNLAQDWQTHGKFRAAGIGNTQQASLNQEIRNDHICWLNDVTSNPAINRYYAAMQDVSNILNQEFYLGLTAFETHFAIYQPGNFYQKHIDQFKNNQERRISCVYYLNAQWSHADGGELQLYDAQDNKLTKVAPRGNRLVCFPSTLPHEVYPTRKTRYSITGWFKTSPYTP